MVISNTSLQATNVVGLVYVVAFIPDEGETLQGLAEQDRARAGRDWRKRLWFACSASGGPVARTIAPGCRQAFASAVAFMCCNQERMD